MMNNSSARYHQKTKKGYKNKTRGKHQNLCEEKKKKSSNMVVIYMQTFLGMKNKSWLSIEKTLQNMEKMFRNKFQMHIKRWL